jgi:hypothetical protein
MAIMDTIAQPATPARQPWVEHACRLLRFNDDVLAQAESLAVAYERSAAPGWATHVGPHLRHIIEHYEALVLRPFATEVDYDARPRDRSVERDPTLARRRIAGLRAALAALGGSDLEDALLVFTQGGLQGQWPMLTASTLNRELVFLASHAVHHYACLREACERDGAPLPPHFGIAPATVAHALRAH